MHLRHRAWRRVSGFRLSLVFFFLFFMIFMAMASFVFFLRRILFLLLFFRSFNEVRVMLLTCRWCNFMLWLILFFYLLNNSSAFKKKLKREKYICVCMWKYNILVKKKNTILIDNIDNIIYEYLVNLVESYIWYTNIILLFDKTSKCT